mgnify:FL=1
MAYIYICHSPHYTSRKLKVREDFVRNMRCLYSVFYLRVESDCLPAKVNDCRILGIMRDYSVVTVGPIETQTKGLQGVERLK